jgi:ABC-type hemin transport system ATPase subunit
MSARTEWQWQDDDATLRVGNPPCGCGNHLGAGPESYRTHDQAIGTGVGLRAAGRSCYFPYTTFEVVLMGCSPDLQFIAGLMTADRHVALAAMDQYDMSNLHGMAMRVLHGGWCPI